MHPFHHGFPLLCLTSDVGFAYDAALRRRRRSRGGQGGSSSAVPECAQEARLHHVAPGVVWKFWFNDEECRFPVSCSVGS